MSFIKWWIKKHSTCKKCQKRWKKIKGVFGIKDAPKFVKVKAKTDEDMKKIIRLLFEDNEENKNVS
tara:strand:+ start:426 stop:623 length:198 start_codon:yes stop_codon:yes gene_type:complete